MVQQFKISTTARGLAAVVGLLLATPVVAQTLDETAASEGVRVAYFNYAPFAYVDDGGEVIGTDVEILEAVLGQMGIEVAEAVATDWGALIPGLRAGRYDVVAAGMFVTPARCAEVAFSEPTFGIRASLVVPAGNPNGITSYEDILEQGATLAAVAGTAQVAAALEMGISRDNVQEYPDAPTALAAVRAGRADAFGADAPSARQIIVNQPGNDFEMVEPFAEIGGRSAVDHGAFAFRQEDQAFVDRLNIAMNDFIGSAEYVAINETHGMTADEAPVLSVSELCGG
ncbi:ectoine/hydroxyectoine ABC transporter substrate-binding protein EhuB [Nioella sp. MMSF_3534]|uniref:ectoine/hydroxyectoine ABC transporter substrate-binding protein EhuB n=1 Tax=Nioella sp. MMSF_3534 TaxID=3046720 RepID=UPI00273FA8F3|nr:ectoine/hydroxyectoine ABC transporter substrate-binding protein EhuB [Nioella sp. MMSF_3534]